MKTFFYSLLPRRWEKFNWLSFWNGLLLLGKEEFFSAEKRNDFPNCSCSLWCLCSVCVCVCGGDGGYKVLEMWAIRMEGVVE